MNDYQFVTAVHGNEPLPTLAIAAMGEPQVVGNPVALARGKRFVDCDLNASFGLSGAEYEHARARELKKLLNRKRKVVDFHTFSCESEPFAIVVDLALLPLARRIGVQHVVYMKHNIKSGHALINAYPGVSVEVGNHTDPSSFSRTQTIVQRLREGSDEVSLRVYEVYGRIREQGNYKNFYEEHGLVPVLYGERAYPDGGFYGLAAREITSTIKQMEEI